MGIDINIIHEKGVVIEYNDKSFKYIEIAKFESIDLSYGISESGWIVKSNNQIYQLNDEINEYIIFLKILEISTNEIFDEIKKSAININSELIIKDLFPIDNITYLAFRMESSYWSSLCIDFLLEGAVYDTSIKLFCRKVLDDHKWFSQKLKHKILKYITRSEKEGF